MNNASDSGDITGIAPDYFLGAGLMIVGGIVAAVLGVSAEQKSLESIAQPLTVDDASDGDDDSDSEGSSGGRSPAPTSV
ncbi:MAG: hypothetical protein ABIQ61_02370 [Ornithinibacter sp.]